MNFNANTLPVSTSLIAIVIIDACFIDQEKLKGNECFKMNENDKAVLHYSRSLAFDDSKAAIWANRAMTYIRLELFNYAEEDCSVALSLDATYVKALFRRGLVRFKMGKYAEVSYVDQS